MFDRGKILNLIAPKSWKFEQTAIYRFAAGLLVVEFVWLIISLVPGIEFSHRLVTIAALAGLVSFQVIRTKNSQILFGFGAFLIFSAGLIQLLFQTFLQWPQFALQFFSLGIDNDPHIQMFKDFFRSAGQLEVVSYPKGQQSIWALLGKISGLNVDSTASVIASYAAMYLYTLILLNLAILLILKNFCSSGFEIFVKFYFIFLIEFVGAFSFMLVGGYPHYLVAQLNLLILLVAYLSNPNFLIKSALTLSTAISLYFICQPFSLILLIALAISIGQEIRSGRQVLISKVPKIYLVGFLVFSSGFVYVGVNWVTKTNPFKWVSDAAAAEPLSLLHLLPTGIALIYLLFSKSKPLKIWNGPTSVLAFSITTVSLIMAIFTFIEANQVTYYAVKQVQFSVFVLVIIWVSAYKPEMKQVRIRAAITILVLAQFVPMAFPKIFKGAVMGSGFKASVLLLRQDSWETETFDSRTLISISSQVGQAQDECVVVWNPEQSLISQTTWLNAINPAADKNCESYQFLEFTDDENQIQMVAKEKNQKFILVYKSGLSPDLAKLEKSKFRVFEIP